MGVWCSHGRRTEPVVRAIQDKLCADNRWLSVSSSLGPIVSCYDSLHYINRCVMDSEAEDTKSVYYSCSPEETESMASSYHTPLLNLLDESEFPSLSGTPQAQQQSTTSQAIWGANPNIRLTQHTPVQRPPTQNAQQQGQQGQPHDAQSQDETSSTTSQSQFRPGTEDYRFGAQGGVGQLSGSQQPQIGNSDDFPPLATGGGDLDRRSSLLQNAPFGTGNASPFPNLSQNRNGLSSPGESQQDRSLASAVGDRSIQNASG